MDRRLLERTAEIARRSGKFDGSKLPKTLKVAVDSSPLVGAAKVEDTINLIAHAARKVVTCAAKLLDREFADVCKQAGIPILLEASAKKALDRDWSNPKKKAEAIEVLARQVLALERWLERNLADQVKTPPLENLIAVLNQLVIQDLEPDPDGGPGVRVAKEQVAEDRRVSVQDPEMRHGRKTKSKRFNGYKRHVATDLDTDAILACALTPANRAEHEALAPLKSDLAKQGLRISEAHLDRGYMGSPVVQEIEREGGEIICKPWRTNNGDLFSKDDFTLNLRAMTIECPNGETIPIVLGRTAEFPANACGNCKLRSQCTTASEEHGRTVNIGQDERLQQRLRKMAATKAGRQRFRFRVSVEHRLAHLGYRQGRQARYCGVRKNLFDMRRAAAIQNFETAQRKAA